MRWNQGEIVEIVEIVEIAENKKAERSSCNLQNNTTNSDFNHSNKMVANARGA